MERALYIGTIEAESYGIDFDYEKDNLFVVNRFLGYLIQHQYGISKLIREQFSYSKAELFLSQIKKYDEFEVYFFLNLNRIYISNCNNLDFQIGNNCIVLSQADIELIFPLPINYLVNRDIFFDDEEVNFEKIEEYAGKKVNFVSDPQCPHIFMTESQIKSNMVYLTKIIDELLSGIELNSSVSKTELANILGER